MEFASKDRWLYRRSFLVATASVESLSWANHRVNIAYASAAGNVFLH